MRHLLEFLALLLCSLPFAVLPLNLSRKVGEFLGLALYRLWGSRRRIAIENIRAAQARGAVSLPGSPEDAIRRNFSNMGRYLAELSKVFYGMGDGLVRGIKVEGMENYRRAASRGKGVMLVAGHCGNWELLALSISSAVGTMHGVARKQSNPYIDRFIVRTREKFGSRIIYKQGALRKFISVLKGGGTVGVLMDQAVLPGEGVLIEFLGAPAWTTRLPVAVARRTGAALVPLYIDWTGGEYVITLLPEAELKGDDATDVKTLSVPIEEFIRRNPSEWLWIHRRWKRAPGSQESP